MLLRFRASPNVSVVRFARLAFSTTEGSPADSSTPPPTTTLVPKLEFPDLEEKGVRPVHKDPALAAAAAPVLGSDLNAPALMFDKDIPPTIRTGELSIIDNEVYERVITHDVYDDEEVEHEGQMSPAEYREKLKLLAGCITSKPYKSPYAMTESPWSPEEYPVTELNEPTPIFPLPKGRNLQLHHHPLDPPGEPGLLTQRQVRELFMMRRGDPDKWTPEALSAKYSIEVDTIKLLLKFYNNYEVHERARDGEPYAVWSTDSVEDEVPMEHSVTFRR
eukprot:gnl/Spiro4/3773_TR1855_c0_g3_i1.p1 gnl/Spiro4/3773_TR1855_c0_g3~~gnl/Spiro4/3773_TR1855_c0_g3_i1.p1  ORF type:complete len:276 (-),score=44.71 gnl/Spiro4/3773_TR1855_c0_g3_i1:192-1019(-)